MPRIAAAQTPEFREDVDAAFAYALEVIADAQAQGADLLVFPEGYPQGYLTQEGPARRQALNLAGPAFAAILARLPQPGPTVVLGLIEEDHGALFNTAAVIAHGRLLGRYRKTHLLAGETCFTPGPDTPAFEAAGLRFGINICYDTNFPEAAQAVAATGATLLVCPANNMMPRPTAEAWRDRHNPIRGERCRETGLWLISADVTGERDGRIAWGPTAVLNPQGQVVAQLPLDQPGLLVFDLPGQAA
ncbi:carbon-nitrogen hydrolase family protein [Phenylobacterium sp. 20VBR1]|uniref:Carbon-nitrogen hydrolase family protein n=2 Tax=Phenylobacterium glaciei TaxID=2803784 RepID=A0A941HY87_9CAUL|nr:carbon-nitrogen hydrolase family protein [Phenylobacterium glaciei]